MKRTMHCKCGLLLTGSCVRSLSMAACSSSTNGGRSGGGEVTQDVKDLVAEYQEAPTEITQTEPLTAAPEKKSVAFIVCADPTCTVLADALQKAVPSCHWDFTAINAPATDLGPAVQQEIDPELGRAAGRERVRQLRVDRGDRRYK